MSNTTIKVLHDPSLDEWEDIYCLCGKTIVECAITGKACYINKDKPKKEV